MADTKRLSWIDTAKGISIILVVMMYSAYSVGEDTGSISYLNYVIGFATPFRMPEFFLISGLFLSQVIARPWARFTDRRAVHYFYFYALWVVIHIGTKTVLGGLNPLDSLGEIATSIIAPYGVLWFIYMLGVFSIAAKILWDLRIAHWVALPLALGLQMLTVETGFYALNQFAEYFVYFYLGYAAAPHIFKFIAWIENHKPVALASLAAWALINGALVFSPGFEILPVHMEMGLAAFPGLHFALAVAGAMAILVASALLAPFASMNWLTWIGAHSIVIYLAFALPMSIIRVGLLKLGLISDVHVLSTVVFVASIISPVVLYFAIQFTGWGKFLFTRPAWASLPSINSDTHPAPRPDQVPAE